MIIFKEQYTRTHDEKIGLCAEKNGRGGKCRAKEAEADCQECNLLKSKTASENNLLTAKKVD